MKLFSLIVALFFVTISGMEHSRPHHHSLFNNPKAFISSSSLSQIDQDTINKMIGLVNDIIDQAEADRVTAQSNQAIAADVEAAKTTERETAQGVVADAQSALTEGLKQLDEYIAGEEEAQRIYDQKAIAEKEAKTNRDAAANTNTEQGKRIDDEKATFEEIKVLIGQITAEEAEEADIEIKQGRNLLSIVDYKYLADVNPTDLTEVYNLIEQLITDGETERNTYISAFNEAEGIYNDAVTTAADAKKSWEITIGQVSRQELTNVDLDNALSTAEGVLESATQTLTAATLKLTEANDFLASENTRIDHEIESCNEIINLLSSFLPEED